MPSGDPERGESSMTSGTPISGMAGSGKPASGTDSSGAHASGNPTPGAGARAAADGESRKAARTITGIVWSDKMQKTRAVRVTRLVKHPKYGKFMRRKTTYYVHDEENASKAGDTVVIAETRPTSKTKRWRLVKVISSSEAKAARALGQDVPVEETI